MLYSAYGLRLDCAFPLTGAREATETPAGLPSLELALCRPEEIEAEWRALDGPPMWTGLLGDGLELSIERGIEGQLLFRYGERACFLLDPDMRRLDCSPRDSGLDWQRTLIGKVIPDISVMVGYEALHAASVEAPGGVLAIMAPSGSGKSTLAAELLARGWPLFADDVLTLSHEQGEVVGHPGTPHVNLALAPAGSVDARALGDTLAIFGDERWLSVRALSERPQPVRMLCVFERRSDLGLALRTLPPHPLSLAPFMLGLSNDRERQRSRFALYADLIESATLVRLTAGVSDRPERLADCLEEAIAQIREQTASL